MRVFSFSRRGGLALIGLAVTCLPVVGDGLRADEPVATSLPEVQQGVRLADGTWAFPHAGLYAPPAEQAGAYLFAAIGARMVGGRRWLVFGYARPGATPEASPRLYYPQTELVDPATGEVGAGGSGPEADDRSAATCAPR